MNQNPLTFRPSTSLLGARNDWREIWAICLCCVVTTSVVAATSKVDPKVEEVIVSARKVEERLQDVPISVAVLSGAQLSERGAVDIKDVLGSVPGLSFDSAEMGRTSYSIRGVNNVVGGAPAVGIYLDDISLTTAIEGAFDAVLFDIERLEVLKGPQGTLYGSGAMGGAIKYVSARPDLSETLFGATAGVATTAHGSESYKAESIVNLPIITDVLAIRAGLVYRHDGGYIDNVAGLDIENTTYSSTSFPTYTPLLQPSLSTVSKEDYNFSDTYVGRLSLLWRPDPSWSIRPMVLYQDTREENPGYFHTNLGDLTSSYRFVNNTTIERTTLTSLEIKKEWRGVELTSVTAYFERDKTWHRDYSFFVGGLVPPLYPFDTLAHYPTNFENFSQELRIASAPEAQSRWSWVAGLFYSSQDSLFDGFVSILDGEQSIFGTSTGIVLNNQRELDQSAAFGEVTYAVTPALDVTAGVRLFKIAQKRHDVGNGPFNGGFSEKRSDTGEDGVNPKFGLAYKLGSDHLLYASAAKGFRPGDGIIDAYPSLCDADLARIGYTSPPTQYDSDNLWAYEVGSKNAMGGGYLVLNGSLFYTDWKDIQQSLSLPNCGRGITANAGAARIRGAELEAQIKPAPGLEIRANAAYSDSEIVDPGFGGIAHKGDEILATPKWMAGVDGSYSLPVGAAWDFTLRGDYQYRGKQRNTFNRVQAVTYSDGVTGLVTFADQFQQSYDVVNASASLTNGPTAVRLYVNNVLDERPHLSNPLSITFGSSFSMTLRPRTIGLEIRQQF